MVVPFAFLPRHGGYGLLAIFKMERVEKIGCSSGFPLNKCDLGVRGREKGRGKETIMRRSKK
jgi:hypothetical protein